MKEATTRQDVPAIVAEVADATETAESNQTVKESDPRMDELERRIRELEAAIGDLRTVGSSTSKQEGVSAAASHSGSRKTQPSYAPRLLAKGVEPVREGGVDAALVSLSVEQRIAVKAGLLRAGLL